MIKPLAPSSRVAKPGDITAARIGALIGDDWPGGKVGAGTRQAIAYAVLRGHAPGEGEPNEPSAELRAFVGKASLADEPPQPEEDAQ